MNFNNDEKEVIIYSLKENINNKKLKSVDIPYSLDLIKRIDKDLNNEDLNLIDYCTSESYNEVLKEQFSNEYSDTLNNIRYRFFVKNNS